MSFDVMDAKIYDMARDMLRRPIENLDAATQARFCEHYLAAAVSVAREFCPSGLSEMVKRAGLNVMLAPRRRRRGFAWLRDLMRRVSAADWAVIGVCVAMIAAIVAGAFHAAL